MGIHKYNTILTKMWLVYIQQLLQPICMYNNVIKRLKFVPLTDPLIDTLN